MDNQFTKEWIQTNGLGGYASSTIEGANTRRYHGLLVAALSPPTDRKVILTKVEERLVINGNYKDLSTNNYKDVVYPKGYKFLKSFNPTPIPTWIFQDDDFNLEKQVLMVQNENATLVNYVNRGDKPIILEIDPLYVSTDYHTLFHENNNTNFYSEIHENYLKTFPYYQSIPVFTKWNKGHFTEARNWYKNIYLPIETKRGLDDTCDSYRIGYISCELKPQEALTLLVSLNETLLENDINKLFIYEKQKLLKVGPQTKSTFYNDLLRSGNQFLVKRYSTDGQSIIAGYHWFSDWGRDTMISMRGLTITTGNKAASQSILSTFFKRVNQGMIPNRFPDHSNDRVEYNAMDATLWLFITLYEYYLEFNDEAFVKKQMPILKDILEWYIKGTHYSIKATPEGFIYGGEAGVQITWMDAMVYGEVITPRIGCPIEINALWYNALKVYEHFCEEFKIKNETQFDTIKNNFELNFSNFFINEEGTLYDVIVPNISSDSSFRPNQLYCLSLPFTILNKEQQKTVFDAVQKKLYTPFGLRTLDSENPNFQGIYSGNQWHRDHEYHQGTVWPFLLSEYYIAFFKIYGNNKTNRKKVVEELTSLKNHFYNEEGLHCISEVFDGKEPKQGKGTIQQAWSVAALIKLYSDYKLYEIDD
ncbi:glycogen debranching enzyme, putative [Flaviramulus basaltis]|uniref:Glycogen debranching enzyme, putative n=1 Tax=Flaviramulus basaltis TaxID=369401 RepID=A0A1K2IRE8_9FLAO|nr:amylo-alpha-1,6-glucosidase [Flaviramulus basaltis]SFZ95013.1 glycogen debranching enzyme, putative [Flaviramulus basaltis]